MAEVTLPQLGETVTEGTITRWFKKVGDAVSADEPLFEVSTDKVDTEVPSPISGTVSEIRAQEGDTVPVGTVIAVVGEASGNGAPAPAAAAQPAAEPAPAPAAAEPAPAPVAAEPAAQPQAEAQPEPQAEPQPQPQPEPRPAPVSAPAASSADTEVTEVAEEAAAPSDSRLLSPVVRRLVAEHDIDVDQVTGTGPGGRITRDDVLDHIDRAATQAAPAAAAPAPPAQQQPPAAPVSAAATATATATAPAPAAPAAPAPVVAAGERDSTVRLSKIRKLTGSHMVMSKGVSPHAFSVVEVDFANVDVARNAVKEEWKAAEGFGLTYLPFITRAVIEAIDEFPHLNASVSGEDLIVHNFVDIGIAVDLDYEGLLVPVVRAAETKRLRAIAREIYDLASRARSRKLGPDEITGGTFTITNNGSAGSVLTMPIINQPQVAILSTDAITRKPVAVRSADGGEAIAIHPVGNIAMAWDHRAFDGAYAAGFLVKIKDALETRDWSAEL
ncbi:MAG TPA: dihydrolipoamide acetyltransferase family protein [Ilumatobacteraceae bacterium]|nr:dihydrolipoamide acetyltransferase family protein [Ilumatobacteraceae bacterium]